MMAATSTPHFVFLWIHRPTATPQRSTRWRAIWRVFALQHFEAFASENGPRFYKLPLNEGTEAATGAGTRERV